MATARAVNAECFGWVGSHHGCVLAGMPGGARSPGRVSGGMDKTAAARGGFHESGGTGGRPVTLDGTNVRSASRPWGFLIWCLHHLKIEGTPRWGLRDDLDNGVGGTCSPRYVIPAVLRGQCTECEALID